MQEFVRKVEFAFAYTGLGGARLSGVEDPPAPTDLPLNPERR
jgi:hypothetical protein